MLCNIKKKRKRLKLRSQSAKKKKKNNSKCKICESVFGSVNFQMEIFTGGRMELKD